MPTSGQDHFTDLEEFEFDWRHERRHEYRLFTQPPAKLAGTFLTTTPELETKSEYIAAEFTGLSFVFLAVHEEQGTALVDTAAQHGLVGRETLEQHDTLLQDRFHLRVQWSHEAGGSVRGVAGKRKPHPSPMCQSVLGANLVYFVLGGQRNYTFPHSCLFSHERRCSH